MAPGALFFCADFLHFHSLHSLHLFPLIPFTFLTLTYLLPSPSSHVRPHHSASNLSPLSRSHHATNPKGCVAYLPSSCSRVLPSKENNVVAPLVLLLPPLIRATFSHQVRVLILFTFLINL